MEDRKVINCHICKTKESKYKCPRCQIRTCCLVCVKEHKNKYKCSGIKDKYNNKIIKDFGEKDFRKDIRFINEMINSTNASSKLAFNVIDDQEYDKKHKNLKKLAKKFRNLTLERCPPKFERFKENKSYCDSKSRKFFWTVRFNFYKENLSHLFVDPFDDSEFTLNAIYDSLISEKSKLSLDLLVMIDKNINKDIKFYIKKVDLKLPNLIKIENNYYVECDKNILLKDVLKDNTIFEYPEFLIEFI
jgi:hypothetical protein